MVWSYELLKCGVNHFGGTYPTSLKSKVSYIGLRSGISLIKLNMIKLQMYQTLIF